MLKNKRVLITGGAGSHGNALTRRLLNEHEPEKVIILSTDPHKHDDMRQRFDDPRLNWLLGDVRDLDRLRLAFHGVDVVVHAAALKQIVDGEYNPDEYNKTNVQGTINVCRAALDKGVERVVVLSSDKAVQACNYYGRSKAQAEGHAIQYNSYVGSRCTKFSATRYGNVMGSRGSVVPFFTKMMKNDMPFDITDERMTRFWMTLEQSVDLVLFTLDNMVGGEVFIPSLPSIRITDLAEAMDPDRETRIVGIREGEKLHEALIAPEEIPRTMKLDGYYIIEPGIAKWRKPGEGWDAERVPEGFEYTSEKNAVFLTVEEIREMVG